MGFNGFQWLEYDASGDSSKRPRCSSDNDGVDLGLAGVFLALMRPDPMGKENGRKKNQCNAMPIRQHQRKTRQDEIYRAKFALPDRPEMAFFYEFRWPAGVQR